MPFSIFEYQDMMHPMGLSPVAPPMVQCNDGSYDVVNGFARPCLTKGGEKPTTPTTPQKCTKDTKTCPGGFIVSRTGANCSFPACPKCAPTYKSGNCSYRLI